MIAFRIQLRIPEANRERFESAVRDTFVPALRRQSGYLGSTLSRLYGDASSREVDAAERGFDHQLELRFDSEASRREWVASSDHAAAWPAVKALAEDVAPVGYDVLLTDIREDEPMEEERMEEEQSGHDSEAPGAVVAAFAKLPTAVISDALDELNLAGALPGLVAQRAEQQRVAGRALTARFDRADKDSSAYRYGGGVGRPLEQVLRALRPGQVVLLDLGGTMTASAWGSLASRLAQLRGVHGTVIHGTCRDVEEIRACGYPVWATGTHPRRSRNEFTFGSLGEPVTIGGITVDPGDIIVADATGVVRVPAGQAAEVLEVAHGIENAEDALWAQVDTGAVVDWDQL